jgi:hypothetical protein
MDLSKISLEVDEMIRRMVSRYNNMYNPAGQITQVELDLLLEDTRRFYETVKLLSEANLQHIMKEKLSVPQNTGMAFQPETKAMSNTQAIPDTKPIPLYNEEELQKLEENEAEEQEVGLPADDEPAAESKATVGEAITHGEETLREIEPEVRSVHVAEEPQEMAPAEKADIIASNFQNSSTISAKFGQTVSDSSMAQNKNLQRISNLKNAISFGDRFLFISELFGGNDGAFDYTVSQLNECNGNVEAMDLFESISERKKWSMDNEAVSRLFELVQRRYI